MTKIVDLSVTIGQETLSPPSVGLQLELTSYHRGPGFWQASKIEMLLHTGSHVDFTKHVQEDGETAADVSLDRVFGDAVVVDLSFAGPNHEISVTDMEKYATGVQPGDIVLVRTDWTEKQWDLTASANIVLACRILILKISSSTRSSWKTAPS